MLRPCPRAKRVAQRAAKELGWPVTSATKRILDEALSLPPEDREELLDALSDSLGPTELSQEWQAEIADRIRRIERGDAVLLDAEQHLRDLRAKYGD